MNPNKEEYTSVTECLSPFTGLKSLDPVILKNAACRGETVHLMCTSLVKGLGRFPGEAEILIKKYARNEEHAEKELAKVNHLVDSFEKWFDDKKKKTAVITPRMYNKYYMITGMPDMVYCNEQNQLVLVDWKTPLAESKTWSLQGSAYSWLLKKMGLDIQIIEFVQLSQTGHEPNIFTYKEDFGLFKSCLQTYRHFYADKVTENLLDYL